MRDKFENYLALEKDWDEYLKKNKSRQFYYDRLLERLLKKHDLTLDEYYDFSREICDFKEEGII